MNMNRGNTKFLKILEKFPQVYDKFCDFWGELFIFVCFLVTESYVCYKIKILVQY